MDKFKCKSTMKLKLQQERGKRDVNGDGDEDAAVHDALASNDICSGKDGALYKCTTPPPSPIAFGGEISARCGVSQCQIVDPSSWGETI
jgi:hypothetical protein